MSQQADDWLARWHRIVSERDMKALREVLAEDVTMGAPPYWNKLQGRDVVHHLLGLIVDAGAVARRASLLCAGQGAGLIPVAALSVGALVVRQAPSGHLASLGVDALVAAALDGQHQPPGALGRHHVTEELAVVVALRWLAAAARTDRTAASTAGSSRHPSHSNFPVRCPPRGPGRPQGQKAKK